MKERVEALNKVEELEHVNLQLQNECDTIGTYFIVLNLKLLLELFGGKTLQ